MSLGENKNFGNVEDVKIVLDSWTRFVKELSSSNRNLLISDKICELDYSNLGKERCESEEILLHKRALEMNNVKGTEFHDMQEARYFYRKYAMLIGFEVQRDLKVCSSHVVVLKHRWGKSIFK